MFEKEADTQETKDPDTWWCTGSVKKCTGDAFHSFPMTLSRILLSVMGFTLSTGCAQTCLCMHMHFAHVQTFACMCANTHTHMFVCVCTHVCACKHLCFHELTCTHTHPHTHTCVCVHVLLSDVLNFLPTCKNACHWEMGCKSWARNDCFFFWLPKCVLWKMNFRVFN